MANRTSRPDDKDAPENLFDRTSHDDLAVELEQNFLASATSGEEAMEDIRDQHVAEEDGGPFVESTAEEEFAEDTDASNPADATREPFPMAGRGATTASAEEEEEEE